ncbi:MAG: DUF3122 domain-containing protein [Prochlorococcaceae cyanobacterium]
MLREREQPGSTPMADLQQTAARSGTPRRRRGGLALVVVAVLVMAVVFWPAALGAAEPPARWTLSDGQGQRWAVSLFNQPDPAYPDGARLRLTALAPAPQPGQAPSHSAALELRDAFAGRWSLPNRSQELVPPDSGTIPAGSAQFALDGLARAPRDGGPVRLEIPLASGATAIVVLGPAPTAALVELIAQA